MTGPEFVVSLMAETAKVVMVGAVALLGFAVLREITR